MVTINSAESNRTSLRYIPEVTWGTTPGAGLTREMRITASDLVAEKETQTSDEIRADRMVPNIIEVAAKSSGSVDWEHSFATHDDILQAFLLGAWSRTMNGTIIKGASVSVTDNNTVTLSGADYRDYFAANRWIKLEGFVNPANNGYFQISAVAFGSGNTTIDVSGTPLVAEVGTAYTKLIDANDVILVSTTTAFTSGNTINGGGSNAFAGQTLQIGQKIYVEGLGKGSGTITVEATDPTEGATFTISDGTTTLIYEVRTNAALVAAGNIHIPLSGTEATMATNIADAIMGQFAQQNSKVSATAAAAVVTLKNNAGAGGSIATSDATAFTVVTFSGGDATKYGFRTIASLPDDDTIVVAETLTTDANGGGATVVIKGSHLRNPGVVANITKQSFTLETGFTDVNKYFVMTGMRPGTFSLNVSAGEIMTGTYEFMGRETTTRGTTLLGDAGTYDPLATTSTEVMNATANVGTVTKNGTTLTSAIREITIEGDASLREQPAVGEKFPAGIGYGRFTLTGTVVAYFETFDFYNDFINHTTISLGFDVADVDHNTYFYTIPALKITSDPIAPGGIDEDIVEEMEWEAQRDPVLNTQFMVDRFSSVFPFSDA